MADKPSIVVYTSITGGKDNLKQEQVTGGLPFHAFVDSSQTSSTWHVHPAVNLFRDPRRNARMHKLLSHQFFPAADYTVWVDGTISVNKDIAPLVESIMADCDIATFRHPERDCVYQEAESCKKFRLDDPAVIDRQMASYRRRGLDKNLGLFETNVLIRKNSRRVRLFNEIWWSELCIHSRRDQLSMIFAAKRAGIKIGIIPGNAQNLPHVNPKRCGNDYFRWSRHLTNR